MSFDWSENLTVAQGLIDLEANNTDLDEMFKEAILRCAIGRAYYVVFCPSRTYLVNDSCDVDPRSHR